MVWQSLLLLISVSAAVCKSFPLEERFVIQCVFRADKRGPAELAKVGGMWPKGYTSKTAIKEDVSLYNHVHRDVNGFSKDDDDYVPTTSSETVAEGWITKYLGGSGCIYKMATYGNLIDCQATLLVYNKFPAEKEFAAIEGIPWSQVMSFAQYTKQKDKYGKLVTAKSASTKNINYDAAKYNGKAHGGAQYALSRFLESH
jgi:hypothetical protein